jgi:hypothetical protein
MNLNHASQHQGVVAWDGTAAHPIDVRHHVSFSFTFRPIADLAADAVFTIKAAPASAGDPCVPGTFVDVPEVVQCDGFAVGAASTVTLPAGTKAGSLCTATLPCKPNAFVEVTGPATATAVAILSGPM